MLCGGGGGGDRGGAGTWGPGGRRGAPRELKIATAKKKVSLLHQLVFDSSRVPVYGTLFLYMI